MVNTPNALDYLSKATNTPKVNLFDIPTVENINKPNIQQTKPVGQNVIQDFLNQTKGKTEFTKKRKAVIKMLQNEEEDNFIEDAIVNQMKFQGVEENQSLLSDNYVTGVGKDVLQGAKDIPAGIKGIYDRAGDRFNKAIEVGQTDIQEKGLLPGAVSSGVAGGLATTGTMFDAAFTAGLSILEIVAPEFVEEAVAGGLEKIAPTLQKVGDKIENFKNSSPEAKQLVDKASLVLEGAIYPGASSAGIQATKTTAQQTAKAGKQVITKGKDTIKTGKQAVVNKADTLGASLESKGSNLRETLSGLEPNEISAIKNTPKKEFEEILNQAKDAKLKPESDYAFTPYHEGAKKANDAFKGLENNIRTNQKTRVDLVKNAPVKKINTTTVRENIVKDIEDTFNITGANKTANGIKYTTVKGRESLLDPTNLKDYDALKLLESVTASKTPLQMMDTVKKMQNLIYDTNLLNKVSKDMKNLVTRSIGKLNKTFKDQMGTKYANILDEMSSDIRLTQDLERIFKAGVGEVGNRGELAMKRLASGTTTSGEVRGLALKIKERLGIDLIKEARLRQLAMDIVGDTRGGTLFQTIKEGKGGLIGKGIESIIEKTPLSKEATALSRAGKSLITKKKKNANTTNNSRNLLNTGTKKATGKANTKSTMDNSRTNDKSRKTTTKKVTKAISNKKGFINPSIIADDIAKLGKKLTTIQIDQVAKSMVTKLGVAKKDFGKAVKLVKQYIRKYGAELKNKVGEMFDDLADKIPGVKSKFIADGKSLDDFSKVGTTKSAGLVGEAKIPKEYKLLTDEGVEFMAKKVELDGAVTFKDIRKFLKKEASNDEIIDIRDAFVKQRREAKNIKDLEIEAFEKGLNPEQKVFNDNWGFAQKRFEHNNKIDKKYDILNPQEKAAFNIYTTDEYNIINKLLRGQGDSINVKLDDRYKSLLSKLDEGLDKLPNYKGVTYRANRIPKKTFDNFKIGDILTEDAYMSTSVRENAIENFIKPSTETRTSYKMKIESKNGKEIGGLSNFPDEQEILFKPGTQFKIKDIDLWDETITVVEQ